MYFAVAVGEGYDIGWDGFGSKVMSGEELSYLRPARTMN